MKAIMLIRTCLVALVLLSGCVSSEIVRPEDVESDTTKEILVLTQDGRLIRMFGGDYQVIRLGEKKLIRGKGKLFLNEQRTEAKPFEGDLQLDEIKSVETRERSALYYTGPIIFGLAVAFFLFVLLVYRGPQAS